jgi:hypothetical protein
VDKDPSEEELRAFVEAALSNLDKQLREPAVIDEVLRERRELWVMLYRASLGFEVRDAPA